MIALDIRQGIETAGNGEGFQLRMRSLLPDALGYSWVQSMELSKEK